MVALNSNFLLYENMFINWLDCKFIVK
jgi:hypothetical protein